jgi:hypothetical protein
VDKREKIQEIDLCQGRKVYLKVSDLGGLFVMEWCSPDSMDVGIEPSISDSQMDITYKLDELMIDVLSEKLTNDEFTKVRYIMLSTISKIKDVCKAKTQPAMAIELFDYCKRTSSTPRLVKRILEKHSEYLKPEHITRLNNYCKRFTSDSQGANTSSVAYSQNEPRKYLSGD